MFEPRLEERPKPPRRRSRDSPKSRRARKDAFTSACFRRPTSPSIFFTQILHRNHPDGRQGLEPGVINVETRSLDKPKLQSLDRLPFKTVAGYGAGDFGFNLAFSLSTLIPALLLHRRGRHHRRRGRHHVPGRPAVGRGRRPAGRPAGGSDDDPLGQVPAVPHVRRGAAAVHELPGLPRAGQLRAAA